MRNAYAKFNSFHSDIRNSASMHNIMQLKNISISQLPLSLTVTFTEVGLVDMSYRLALCFNQTKGVVDIYLT